MKLLKENNVAGKIPVIIGGIIPESDFDELKRFGVSDIFTPRDFNLLQIMKRNMEVVERLQSRGLFDNFKQLLDFVWSTDCNAQIAAQFLGIKMPD